MNPYKENRIGRFEVPEAYVHNADPSALLVFGKVFIVRAECLFHKSAFEYYGYSELFEKVELGKMVPMYKFVIDHAMETIEAIRID